MNVNEASSLNSCTKTLLSFAIESKVKNENQLKIKINELELDLYFVYYNIFLFHVILKLSFGH